MAHLKSTWIPGVFLHKVLQSLPPVGAAGGVWEAVGAQAIPEPVS